MVTCREGAKYQVYFYAEHGLGPDGTVSASEEVLMEKYHRMCTTTVRPREDAYIEWDQLTKHQQDVEVLAAIKVRGLTRIMCCCTSHSLLTHP